MPQFHICYVTPITISNDFFFLSDSLRTRWKDATTINCMNLSKQDLKFYLILSNQNLGETTCPGTTSLHHYQQSYRMFYVPIDMGRKHHKSITTDMSPFFSLLLGESFPHNFSLSIYHINQIPFPVHDFSTMLN